MKASADMVTVGERLDHKTVAGFRLLVGAIAVVVLATGCTVLLGYLLHSPTLVSVLPDLRAMSVITAVSLCLLASSVLNFRSRVRSLGRVSHVLVGTLAVVVLVSHAAFQADVLSRPLAARLFGYDPETAGRMSLATALTLILIAAGLDLKIRSAVHLTSAADVCAGLGLLVSGTALVGYAYGVRDLYDLLPFNTIAVHTSASLVLLSIAALLIDPERGWAATVASDQLGGGAARRQLLLALLIPVLGAFLLWAANAKEVGPNLAMALLVVLTAASLALLILRDARTQNVLDAERRTRTEFLARAKADVDAQLQQRIMDLAAETQERLRVEEALRQSQKLEAIGQLTGSVAHDFNNLMTVIRSSADLLARPNLPEARRQKYVAAISDTVTRAAKLTGQLLAFARRQALKPEVFDIGQAIGALGDTLRTLTGSGVEVTVRVPVATLFVDVDPSQFDTAVVNMAVNARDAMKGEGRLTIDVEEAREIPPVRAHAAKAGDFVAIRTVDTGGGIPPELLRQVFEPFFTTKGVGHGTGLGLSQVFGFAKQSGGDVRVESEVGQGSAFTMYLPRVAGEVRAPDAEPEPLMDGHGTCVLVVEDNVEVGAFATQALEELGYETVLAANADEALATLALGHGRLDVVFSDVIMPGMNGIDLGHEIRRLYHDLPVVLTSGYSHVLAQNGTYGFELLHKPYSVEELSCVLCKAAKWRQRQAPLPSGS